MRQRHPVGTTEGVHQVAFTIKLEHRRIRAMKGIDKTILIDGDVGYLTPLDIIWQGLRPVGVQNVLLSIAVSYQQTARRQHRCYKSTL